MPFIQHDDMQIYYEFRLALQNKDETIVLIHGCGLDCSIWGRFSSYLEDHYHILIFDLRGCGKSGNSAKEPSWDLFCKDIYQVITELNLVSFHLLGHSFGASLAVKFVNKYPALIKCLVLISIISVYPEPVARKTAASYFSLIEDKGFDYTLKNFLIPAFTSLPFHSGL